MASSDIIVKIGGDVSEFSRAWKQAEGATQKSTKVIENMVSQSASTMESRFKSISGVIAGAFAAGSVAGFAKSILDATIQLDSMQRTMTAVYGSSSAASAEMDKLRGVADRTGQNVYVLVDSFNKLSAATKGTALEGDNTRKIFSAVSEAASVLGLSTEKTNLAFNALSQMASKGKVQMEELKGQLGEQLPGALNLMANGLGVSAGELLNMAEKGELGTEAILAFADATHDAYGAAAQTAALESGQAAVNKLSEAWFELKTGISDSGVIVETIHLITGALKGMSAVMRAAKAQESGMFSGEAFVAGAAALEGQELAIKRISNLDKDIAATEAEIARIRSHTNENGQLSDLQIQRIGELNAGLADQRIALLRLQDAGAVFGDQARELQRVTTAHESATAATKQHAAVTDAQHQKLVSYIETERQRAEAAYQAALNGARTDEERAAAGSKYAQVLSDIAERETRAAQASERRVAAGAKRDDQKAIQETTAAISNYVREADKATKAVLEWADAASEASDGMESLAKDYGTSGLTGYERLVADMNVEFDEGKKKIDEFERALSQANDTVSRAESEYEAAKSKLDEFTSSLDKTSLSEERIDTKTSQLTKSIDEKAEALEEAKERSSELFEQYKNGAITTEQLRKAIFGATESLEAQRKAIIADARASDDFFAGFASGVLEMQDSMSTMGQVGADVFESLRDAWSDGFYAVITGDFEDLGDIWESMLNRMLRTFSNWIADLLLQWALSGIAEMITGQGFSLNLGGGSGGGGISLGTVASLASSGYSAATGESLAGTAASSAASYLGIGGGTAGVAGSGLSAGPSLAAYEANIAAGMTPAQAYSAAASGVTASGTGASTVGGTTVIAGSGSTVVTGAAAAHGAEFAAGAEVYGGAAGAEAASTGTLAAVAPALGYSAAVMAAIYMMSQNTRSVVEMTSPTFGITTHPTASDNMYTSLQGYGRNLAGLPGTMSDMLAIGSGGDEGTFDALAQAAKDMRAELDGVIDLLANEFGDAIASVAMQLDGSVQSADAFVDAVSGYDVALGASAEMHALAEAAANGQSGALATLERQFMALGLSEQQARTAAMSLVAGIDGFQSAVSGTTSTIYTAQGAILGMQSAVEELNSTPLSIRINATTGTSTTSPELTVTGHVSHIEGALNNPDSGNYNPVTTIGTRYDIIPVDRHAVGGIFNQATLLPSINGYRHLVGESGAEAITPLHAGPETLRKMHDDIKAIGAKPVHVTINLDGKQIGSAVMPMIDAHVSAKASRNQLGNRTVY